MMIMQTQTQQEKKPEWLKVKAPSGEKFLELKQNLRDLKLYTVCEEARCPNIGECWKTGTATIMLLGDVCTRACKFCAVKTGRPGGIVDEEEPEKVSSLIVESGLEYVVLTSVDRDDLPDGGANHFALTVEKIKSKAKIKNKNILVECLVSDYRGSVESVRRVVDSQLDVYAHNVETVKSLQRKVRDPRANYEQSIHTLIEAKKYWEKLYSEGKFKHKMLTKTSIQLGHGEKEEEVIECLKDLRLANVDVVTFGQYLQPNKKLLPVVEYISPLMFRKYEEIAKKLGFLYVASGPLVRSSYKAAEYYLANILRENKNGN
jgi:lipoic acid synthetase